MVLASRDVEVQRLHQLQQRGKHNATSHRQTSNGTYLGLIDVSGLVYLDEFVDAVGQFCAVARRLVRIEQRLERIGQFRPLFPLFIKTNQPLPSEQLVRVNFNGLLISCFCVVDLVEAIMRDAQKDVAGGE